MALLRNCLFELRQHESRRAAFAAVRSGNRGTASAAWLPAEYTQITASNSNGGTESPAIDDPASCGTVAPDLRSAA